MRQPGPPLAATDAELLEPLLDVVCEQARAAAPVLEDEHAHASRLAVASGCEADLACPSSRVAERADDRLELPGGAVPEEGERDVQVLAPHETDVRQLLALPALDLVEGVVRQAQREEEPEPFIAAHATG